MERWNVCRLCLLSNDASMKSIPDVTYNMIPFFNIYFELVGNTFSDYPSFPGWICSSCEKEMLAAYKFREKCLQTEEKLKDLREGEASENIEFVAAQSISEAPKEEEKVQSTNEGVMQEKIPGPSKKVYKVTRKEMQILKTKSIQCTRCSKLCNGIEVFRNHTCNNVKGSQPQQPEKEKEKKVYQCDKCGRTFLAPNSYYLHMDRHKNIQRYSCRYCDEKFSCWIKRRTHIHKVHLKKSYLECSECGKGFNKTQDLKNHKDNYHLHIHLYQCEVCGKSFKRMRDLRFHIQSHQDNLNCEICDKKLKHMRTLMIHMKTHGKLQTWTCPVCFRNIVGYLSMKDHVQRLHPDQIHLIPSKDYQDNRLSLEEQRNK